MTRYRRFLIAVTMIAFTGAFGVACSADGAGTLPTAEAAEGMVEAPVFEVDPFWPKPLPNHWILGATIGVTVDSEDHIWIVQRNTPDQFAATTELGSAQDPPVSECCSPAPPILQFDQEGNLLSAWGGPVDTGEYDWPLSNHGIAVDPMGNVWIGGNGGPDGHVLKFAQDGTFLLQVGSPGNGVNSNSMENFAQAAKVTVDAEAGEVYVADGYRNKRVVVIDMETGEFKRFWGAYGNTPEDGRVGYTPGGEPPQQFRGPVHCAEPSNDGLVYVCDRGADRIQVFQKDGTYVTEAFFSPETLSQGSTWDIAFSRDADQKYLYVADGQNMKVYVVLRETMEVLSEFGDGGRQPGQFFAVHSIATDSGGNIYTTETYEGKRVQKFAFKGIGNVAADQGVIWPAGGGN
jgi:DNA-binding beta-propeller fold protein YncE